jgi:hypothetical protein
MNSKKKVTPQQVAELGKIPQGSIAVFENGSQVELSGPPLGNGEKVGIIGKNYEKFKNPVTKYEDTIGVTGPYITNQVGNDIKGLNHFLVPATALALS